MLVILFVIWTSKSKTKEGIKHTLVSSLMNIRYPYWKISQTSIKTILESVKIIPEPV